MLDTKRVSLRERPRRVMMTVDDCCRVTGLGRSTIYELLAARKLESIKVGRRRLILCHSLERLIADAAND